MKTQAIIHGLIAAAAIACCGGCSSSVSDAIIDNQVASIVAAENKKLPTNLGDGVQLVNVDYAADSNQLTLYYAVQDPEIVTRYRDKILAQANQRVSTNSGLQRAMKNGIRVVHEFGVGVLGDPHRSVLLEFESRQ